MLALLLTLTAPSQTAFAQRKSAVVTGVVIDAATQQPLVGVTCIVEGTHKGTTTGADGTFSVNLAPGHDKAITFSCLGYESRTINWAGETALKIELAETAQSMDEVIVVGYGTQKKSNITGAVGSVSKDRIEKMVSTDIAQIMQGAVPGLNIMSTEAGANPEGQSGLMLIRGRNSISASNEPLIVLDGSPYYGSISDISPSDIASIEVLKDASSAAIYGSRGSNGVILINTRQGQEGKVTIRYDGYYAIQTVANFPHIMNGDEYFNYKKNWNDNDDSDPDASLNETERAVYEEGSWRDWSWKDLLTRTGYSTRHNVSASGGTDNYNCGAGASGEFSAIYKNWATANVATDKSLKNAFSWLYNTVLAANTVIGRIGNPEVVWSSEQSRLRIEAEARLIRAWAYRHLTYMWGKVPLTLTETTGENFRTDWVRDEVSVVRAQIIKDLKFAADAVRIVPGGAIEMVPGKGSIITRRTFRDYHLHLEFRLLGEKTNGGVYMQSRYEFNIKDSWGQGLGAPTGALGNIASPEHPEPAFNYALPPMVWQTLDIDFRAPRLDAEGQKRENARATLYLNGQLIYDDVELDTVKGAGGRLGVAEESPIYLQEHGTAYQFRNIWLVEKGKGGVSAAKRGPKSEAGEPQRKAPGVRKPANKGGKKTN